MIVTELYEGTELYILVGGKGTRLASVTNGFPKPLVDVNGKPFIEYVLENLKGFNINFIASGCATGKKDSSYRMFGSAYGDGQLGYNVKILDDGGCEGGPGGGTGGWLNMFAIHNVEMPESFYIMNGDTYFTGDLNLDVNRSTVFVAEEDVAGDVGYIEPKKKRWYNRRNRVNSFVEKNPNATGKQLVNLGIYKFYKKDLPLSGIPFQGSIEYDILPYVKNLEYKVLNTDRFDIGTPERLEKFKTWQQHVAKTSSDFGGGI